MGKHTIRQQIAALNPQQDHCRIVRLSLEDGLLWDVVRALELALFRTFAVPSIAKLLDKTSQFEAQGQKRYDDTTQLLLTLLRDGYDTPFGQAALARINRSHGHYVIANDDFLFVLSTFVLDPIDWLDRFAWRKTLPQEQEALFYFWQAVGQRMGIKNIPSSLTAMRAESNAYAAAQFSYAPANARVAEATLRIMANWLPKPLRSQVKPAACALLDDLTLRAFGFERPSAAFQKTLFGAMALRQKTLRLLPVQKPHWPNGALTYPSGYQIEQLAPTALLSAEQRKNKQPPG